MSPKQPDRFLSGSPSENPSRGPPGALCRALLLDSSNTGYTILPTQTGIPIPLFPCLPIGNRSERENLDANYREDNQAKERGALHLS
jgi:hypothetical protein